MTDEAAETRHPYNHRHPIPETTRLLIVGTAPPPRFFKRPWSPTDELDFDFYYGSGANWMWAILPEALGKKPLSDSLSSDACTEAACNLLSDNNLWMHDLLDNVRRKAGHEDSPLDSHIATPQENDFADFPRILGAAKNLHSIATTSECAFNWLLKVFKFQGLKGDYNASIKTWTDSSTTYATDEDTTIAKHKRPAAIFELPESRIINVYVLPSPSSARGMRTELKVKVYRHVFAAALSAR